jgi:hypothetical protein
MVWSEIFHSIYDIYLPLDGNTMDIKSGKHFLHNSHLTDPKLAKVIDESYV